MASNNAHGSNRRRFLSVKSAPLADLIPKDFDSISIPPPPYIFGKLHPSIRNLAVAVALYLGIGTIVFYGVLDDIKGNKENPVVDSLYFTVTTMTTVGYGDLVPNNTPVKALCCVFVVIGMALVGLIITKAADYIVDKQEMMLVKALSKEKEYGPFKIMKDLETQEVSFKCIVVMSVQSGFMLVGTIFLYVVEELDFMDAIFCVFTTMTTVGYGDKAFATRGGRVFAIIWVLTITFGLSQLFMFAAEYFIENRQKALVNWVLNWRMTNQVDNDGVAEAAEFAVHKLKVMGKISQEDISRLMKEFKDIDVHQRGFLSASDIALARAKR